METLSSGTLQQEEYDYLGDEHTDMVIFIKMMFGRSMEVNIGHTDTVYDVKRFIQDSQGIPADNMILVYAGVFLDDDLPLSSYNIAAESSLNLIIKDQSAKPPEPPAEDEGEEENGEEE